MHLLRMHIWTRGPEGVKRIFKIKYICKWLFPYNTFLSPRHPQECVMKTTSSRGLLNLAKNCYQKIFSNRKCQLFRTLEHPRTGRPSGSSLRGFGKIIRNDFGIILEPCSSLNLKSTHIYD